MLKRKPDPKAALLRRSACLDGWDDREVALLAHLGDIAHFRATDTITTRGARARHAYLILRGVAAAHTANSSPLVETALIDGQAALERQETTKTIVAETDLEVVALTAANLARLLRDCPSLHDLLAEGPAVTERAAAPRSHAGPVFPSAHLPTAARTRRRTSGVIQRAIGH